MDKQIHCLASEIVKQLFSEYSCIACLNRLKKMRR